jgi:sulfate transporter 3
MFSSIPCKKSKIDTKIELIIDLSLSFSSGEFSHSDVNHNAGCKTAMSNVIKALTVMVTLLFLMPLFVYTPNGVLGAIVDAVVTGLIHLPPAYHIWKKEKLDFLVCSCAFAGAIFISVQEGLAIAVTNRIDTDM